MLREFLRQKRKSAKLTQEQAGNRIGYTARTVSRWETGLQTPSEHAIIELATVYNLKEYEVELLCDYVALARCTVTANHLKRSVKPHLGFTASRVTKIDASHVETGVTLIPGNSNKVGW